MRPGDKRIATNASRLPYDGNMRSLTSSITWTVAFDQKIKKNEGERLWLFSGKVHAVEEVGSGPDDFVWCVWCQKGN